MPDVAGKADPRLLSFLHFMDEGENAGCIIHKKHVGIQRFSVCDDGRVDEEKRKSQAGEHPSVSKIEYLDADDADSRISSEGCRQPSGLKISCTDIMDAHAVAELGDLGLEAV